MERRPLAPAELFPAGRRDIAQRVVPLASGVAVRLVERGAADAPPVVLLPGWASPAYMFRHAFTELVARGFRVIACELRGCGLSDKPQRRGAYALDAYLADLDALLDTLRLERTALVGQSMGGGIALHYALRRPARVRCAALINPTNLVSLPYLVLLRAAPPRLVEAFSRGIVRRSVVRFVLRRLVYANPACVTPQDVDEYWSPTRLPGFGFAARASLGEFDWSPVSDELADRLAVPTLVMLGDADRLVHNTERDARRLRGAIVRVVPGGHSAQEENPGAAYAALAEFLAGGWQ